MLDEDDLITQLNLAEYREIERAFEAVMDELRRHIREGRKIEPGSDTVNVPALMMPFPRAVVPSGGGVPQAPEMPPLAPEGFALMRGLLSHAGTDALMRSGLPGAARSRRRLNRKMYRILLALYAEHMREVFQCRLCEEAEAAAGDGREIRAAFSGLVRFRWHLAQLRLAPVAHWLRVSDPCALVDGGMRGIAFLINQLAVIPPSWK